MSTGVSPRREVWIDYTTAATVADTGDFATWLWDVGERNDLTLDHLCVLYEEFCEFSMVRPLTRRRLINSLQAAGIRRSRPNRIADQGRGGRTRPTVYNVRPTIEFKIAA